MRKAFKVLGIVVIVILVVAGGGIGYFLLKYPAVDKPADLKVEITPARVERGAYLANHVTVCMDCHSTRNWDYFSGPILPGTEGKGGDKFGREMGLPGDFYTKNITPAALGTWNDGELFRAITAGVGREGNVYFPMMPFLSYAQLAEEDIYSIIAYVRTLKPIENQVPASHTDFPLNFILRTLPKNYQAKAMPPKSDWPAYGKYLTTAASCTECHTPVEKGQPIPGKEFAGGQEFVLPFGTVRTSNITPDPETGIGRWTKEVFVNRFKAYGKPEMKQLPVVAGNFNTVMPWTLYAGMTEEDLGAIYDYLKSFPAVHNKIEKFTPPAKM
jgi:mono/diheme cytochrome c family protein